MDMFDVVRDLRTQYDKESMTELLAQQGLATPKDVDRSIGIFEDDLLIACASRKGDILQGIAVSSEHRGENLTGKLLSVLLKDCAEQGMQTVYLFTKPINQNLFSPFGFRTIVTAEPYAVMMEYGLSASARYAQSLQAYAKEKETGSAVIVMNANPFTLGHRYLVERACRENEGLYILVVEEDKSEFSFKTRFELVKRGTADLDNVTVIPSGRFAVSGLTFPSYFTPDAQLTHAQAAVDAEVFGTLIAPALNVTKRYVGTEPFSPTTAIYNEELSKRLSKYGVELVVVEREQAQNGIAISASEVRRNICSGMVENIKCLVPDTTYQYILNEVNNV